MLLESVHSTMLRTANGVCADARWCSCTFVAQSQLANTDLAGARSNRGAGTRSIVRLGRITNIAHATALTILASLL